MSSPASASASPAASSSPARKPLLRKLGRALGTLVVGAALALLAAFASNHLAHPAPRAAALPWRALLALGLVAGPAWLLVSRLRPAPARPAHARLARARLAPWLALAASLALFFTWLGRDDAAFVLHEEHPLLRSDFPEAAATHALVLRYSKRAPGSLHDEFPAGTLVFPSLSDTAESREAWSTFLTAQREPIQARWEELAPVRAWFAELAAAPALADLTAELSDPIPAFGPLRGVARATAAQASLLALEGRRDEAVDLLLPVLRVGEKLEPHARTLVRRMIAVVLQRQALAALAFVLDQGPISDATRARLAAALRPHQDPAEGARLLLLCEYPLSSRTLLAWHPAALAPDDSPRLFAAFGSLLFTPRATVNDLGDLLHAQADAAAVRDLAEMKRLAADTHDLPPLRRASKNAGGRLLIGFVLPAYSKVVETYWQTHDERAALLARL